MGCLAAVLNLLHAAERLEHDFVVEDDHGSYYARNKSSTDDMDEERIDSIAATNGEFSVKFSDNTFVRNSSGVSTPNEKLHILRTCAFQRALLNMSAELLLLDRDSVTFFLSTLDIVVDSSAKDALLLPFLESISNEEAAFQCITLLLFRFILLSNNESTKKGVLLGANKSSIIGYDARVRRAFKFLAISVFSHFSLQKDGVKSNITEHNRFKPVTLKATEAHSFRKFEALEKGLASRLLIISRLIQDKPAMKRKQRAIENKQNESKLSRGLKIGASGIAAGALFAITGGLAAPLIGHIVAGTVAVVAGTGIITSAITLLAGPATVTLFGVGGSRLVMRKVSNRMRGLENFEIKKETADKKDCAELSRTICIAGWLRDGHDFQRPFGLTPDGLKDTQELLGRFCSVYSPSEIAKCPCLLQEWRGNEKELWDILRTAYKKDPDSLLPLTGLQQDAALTCRESNLVNDVIESLGFPRPMHNDVNSARDSPSDNHEEQEAVPVTLLSDMLTGAEKTNSQTTRTLDESQVRALRAWDYHAEYGGEQYTVVWEKDLLLSIRDSAKDFQKDLKNTAARTVLTQLVNVVALPVFLLDLANMIDEKWTLISEISDEAGVALAQGLLESNAGHRPVSLVGFSFGARIIYSCLKELARNQDIWERVQRERERTGSSRSGHISKENYPSYTREPASIVEDVVFMGCPAFINIPSWTKCRSVVAGRFINCYSSNDLILKVMYRMKNLSESVFNPPVGTCKADFPGVENYDVSELIDSHSDYCIAIKDILEVIRYGQPKAIPV